MKKHLLFFSLLCLLLVGCSDSSKNDNKTTSYIRIDYDYYQKGVVVGNKQGITKYLDYETMEKVPLCAVPNCTHSDSNCIANMIGKMPIFYNDFIYYFETNKGKVRETADGKEFYIDSTLKKVSLNTSQIDVVCEFHDAVPPLQFNGYVLHGNELYFVGDDYNPIKDEYGGYSWGNTGGNHYLCCINLDNGEYTNLGNVYDDEKKYEASPYSSSAIISGVYKNKMYLYSSFYKTKEEMKDPDGYFTTVNFEFDFDKKTWKESELPSSKFMNDDIYTYYDHSEKKLHIINDDGDRTIYFEYIPVRMNIVDNKLFYPSMGLWYDLTDMLEHSMGKYTGYHVVDYFNKYYILVGKNEEIKLTEEELLALDKE